MVVYASSITPEISLEEFTSQLQEMQAGYDDYYISEITVENGSEFYYVDGEEMPLSEDGDIVAEVSKNDFEIPVSAISDYCEMPETSTYSLETESAEDITVDKGTAVALGYEVEIKDDTAVLTQPYQTKRLIVKSKYDINPLDSVAIVEGYNDLHIVQFDNQESAKQAQEYYEKQKLIEYAEPDLVVTTMDIDYIDTNSAFANSISSYGSHLSWGSDSIAVDDFIDTLSEIDSLPEIVVGIIDTGIDLDHEFLKDRIIETNYNTSSSGDQNSEDDDEGHGTHVAGIVADNTTDNIKIKSYKTLNSSGSGSISNVATSVDYAVNDGVNVINMSLGTKGESTSMENAVNRATKAGVVICVAAGNDGSNASKHTPANIKNCITVAAIDEYDKAPYWTNWGRAVNIVAPGVSIYSTYNNGGYETLSGTSMACPFVCASAALLLSKNRNYSRDEICDLLVENGRVWSKATDNGLVGIPALYIGNVETLLTPRTAQPYFSMEAGRYRDSITVEISCDDSDAKIYYTTDGTRATDTNGTLYTEPIVIDKVTTLSASAYAPDKLKSIQMSARYYITYLDDESNFEIDSNGIITAYYGSNEYLSVPDSINDISVIGIGESVFMSSNMVMIKLPDSATYIGRNAFLSCNKLYSVDAKNIENVQNQAFRLCSKLELFDFSKIENIGEYAFASCRSLISVNGDNITNISNYGFNGCDKIINVNIPKCIKIGDNAFASNLKLENISMSNVEIIGSRAFRSCTKLTEIYLPNLQLIEFSAFNYCRNLTTIDISNYEGEIPRNTFSYASIENINLPRVTVLGNNSFDVNKSLKSVYLPNVITIGTNCFDGDNNLEILFAPKLTSLNSILPNGKCTLYLSDEFEKGINNTSYAHKVIAPSGSYAEQWAKENNHTFIPSDYRDSSMDSPINVEDKGRSIRVTNAGLRFGFSWDEIPEIEELASKVDYGFVYHYNYDNEPYGSDKLTIDNVGIDNIKKKEAVNLDDSNDGKTVFNLVFTNIPDSNQNTNISVRAYVCIDGMYFYSNSLNGSFSEVSNLVLADEEIDNSTKTMLNKILKGRYDYERDLFKANCNN